MYLKSKRYLPGKRSTDKMPSLEIKIDITKRGRFPMRKVTKPMQHFGNKTTALFNTARNARRAPLPLENLKTFSDESIEEEQEEKDLTRKSSTLNVQIE